MHLLSSPLSHCWFSLVPTSQVGRCPKCRHNLTSCSTCSPSTLVGKTGWVLGSTSPQLTVKAGKTVGIILKLLVPVFTTTDELSAIQTDPVPHRNRLVGVPVSLACWFSQVKTGQCTTLGESGEELPPHRNKMKTQLIFIRTRQNIYKWRHAVRIAEVQILGGRKVVLYLELRRIFLQNLDFLSFFTDITP